MTAEKTHPIASYSQIACVGTGLSAIALGATLKRWYDLEDIRFFEREKDCGGTWYVNSYPGCACDVPSALYSFSFALNPNWTKLMPSYKEVKAYQDEVIATYGLRQKMTFSTEVVHCIWREDASRWLMTLRNLNTGEEAFHECQVLFVATGLLAKPQPCNIPGASSFSGAMFHSARWDHDVSLEGKRVVVIGNGCTATQIVPAIVDKTQSLTQLIRSQHWVSPTLNFSYGPVVQWMFRNIPLVMQLHRFHLFLMAEGDFRLFPMTKAAARLREQRRKDSEQYMRETAPTKYHDILIPDTERRVFDCGYLQSLHNEKLLLTDAQITRIVPEGIETANGIIPANVIVLATGFQTNRPMMYMQVQGQNGITLEEHWKRYGGPGAYNCSVMSGFPNLFMILGPNTATGHTSALMALENMKLMWSSGVNYALRVLKPVLNGDASSVEVKQEAEDEYIYKMQDALRQRVWNTGCASWYVNDKKWNAVAYPWTQAHYWYRCLFPVWSHWNIKEIKKPKNARRWKWVSFLLLALSGSLVVGLQEPSFVQVVQSWAGSTVDNMKRLAGI